MILLENLLTHLPYRLKGIVYRSPLPFSWLFDSEQRLFDAFKTAGVETVVMLTPIDETIILTGRDMRAFYKSHGLDVIYVPVQDFSIPEKGVFQTALPEALEAVQSGKTLAIHCHAGIGRTGMFAACLAKIVFNMDGESAVYWVRKFIPDAVENQRQFRFVVRFELPKD